MLTDLTSVATLKISFFVVAASPLFVTTTSRIFVFTPASILSSRLPSAGSTISTKTCGAFVTSSRSGELNESELCVNPAKSNRPSSSSSLTSQLVNPSATARCAGMVITCLARLLARRLDMTNELKEGACVTVHSPCARRSDVPG